MVYELWKLEAKLTKVGFGRIDPCGGFAWVKMWSVRLRRTRLCG